LHAGMAGLAPYKAVVYVRLQDLTPDEVGLHVGMQDLTPVGGQAVSCCSISLAFSRVAPARSHIRLKCAICSSTGPASGLVP